MRGFNERSPGSSSGEAKKEGMPYYMGAFLAIALDWRAQAKTKAIDDGYPIGEELLMKEEDFHLHI